MMATYPAYRDSGLPWVGEIPDGWQVLRAKTLAYLIQTGPFGSQLHNHDYVPGGTPVINPLHLVFGRIRPGEKARVSVEKAKELDRHKLMNGDVVLARRGDLGRSAVVTQNEAGWLCGTGSILYRPDVHRIHPEFFSRLIGTPACKGLLVASSVGTTMANLNPITLSALPVVVPPRREQDQIVAYLRAQDAHIARFIKAKRDLIGLLTEQKLSIIDHAVTRGLDASVRLKPSGIEWLGDVPEGWEVLKLKFATKRIVGGSTPKSNEPSYWGGGIVWATPRDISKTDSLQSSQRTISVAGLQSCAASLVPPESIVITSRAPVGNVAKARVELCTNQGCKAIVPASDIATSDYLFLLLLRMKGRLQILANGTTFTEIGTWVLANEFIPVPPVTEQQAIVSRIKAESAPLDEAIARAEDEIALIREYRDRLIADAVTGQVDLRGWQPAPDDGVSDDVLAALGDDDSTDGEYADGEED